MQSLIHTFLILAICVPPCVVCDDKTATSEQSMPTWQKLCLLGGLVVTAIVAFLYKHRNREIRIYELIQGYVSAGQSQITFVNLHHNSSGREVIEEAMVSESIMEKSNSIDEENSYIEKDQELSIDSEEAETKHLGSVFEQKQGAKQKKSKSRKRLANTAKIVEDQPQTMSPPEDL